MEENPEGYRQHLVSRFAAQPAELRASLGGLSPAQALAPLAPGEWSAHQVLAHLLQVEQQAFAPRIRRMLEETEPELPSFDPEMWMQANYDPSATVEALLEAFQTARAESVDRVRGLDLSGWNRGGYHAERGRRTLQWWVEYAATHAQEHLDQLRR
jgi:hypothetical protein